MRHIFQLAGALGLCACLAFSGGCELPIPNDDSGQAPAEGQLSAIFLDVGQADAALFTFPDGRHMLVDGGNNNDGDKICDYLREAGVERLEYMVATHPHEDHIGGLDEVLEQFQVDNVYAPVLDDGDVPTTKTYEDFLTAVEAEGCGLTPAAAGDRLLEESGLSIEVLSPAGSGYTELNDYSIVLRVDFGQTSWLLTGDAEALVEAEMLEGGCDVSADLLKVGHHGSDSSSSAAFLQQVKPANAVISCGADNSYGHPHESTLEALEGMGANLWRTDLQGSIRAVSDGTETKVEADPTVCCDGSR